MDLAGPTFPTPGTTSAIYHTQSLKEEDIRVLHWRQHQEEKPEGGTEFIPGIRRNAQF